MSAIVREYPRRDVGASRVAWTSSPGVRVRIAGTAASSSDTGVSAVPDVSVSGVAFLRRRWRTAAMDRREVAR